MGDYNELIAELRKWQALGDAPVGNGFGVIVDKLTLKQAADVIEQLVKDNDALLSLVNKLGKRYGPCDVCGADCPGAFDRYYQRKQALGFHGGDCPKYCAPTIITEPVIHGHWVAYEDNKRECYCSNCEFPAGLDDYGYHNMQDPYCRFCGAKMDGKENDND